MGAHNVRIVPKWFNSSKYVLSDGNFLVTLNRLAGTSKSPRVEFYSKEEILADPIMLLKVKAARRFHKIRDPLEEFIEKVPIPRQCPIMHDLLELDYDLPNLFYGGTYRKVPELLAVASIDHINPHVKNDICNLRWISWLANRVKSDISPDQLLQKIQEAQN